MKMMTNYWSSPGDTSDHKFVEASCDNPMLAVYANVKPDGSLALLAVNKDPKNSYEASINIAGYSPEKEAKIWTFDSDNYRWNLDSTPYHADPSNPPTESGIGNAGEKFNRTFKPYSLTVILMNKK
jgi:hypothetical protein